MKSIKTLLLLIVITIVSFSCKKSSGDSGQACENNETTKVTFKNNTTVSLRIEVAKTFNAQYMPVDAVFTIDVAAGASTVKEFRYGRYFIQWKQGCINTCSQKAFYAKDFEVCKEYTESQ
jgi:hypothetical protein